MIFMNADDAEKHQAAHAVAAHQIKQMMLGLSEDDLVALCMILDGIGNAPDAGRVATYWSGRVTSLMETRFNICSACNTNHDADLEKLASDDTENPVPPHVEARRNVEEANDKLRLTDEQQAQMQEYNLDDLRDEGTGALLGFVCLNCSMKYPSIEARTDRSPGPEGCEGCLNKVRWG